MSELATQNAQTPHRPAKKRFLGIEKNYYGYIFVLPFIIGFLVFGLYPLLNTLYLSLTDRMLMVKNSGNFIWFQNFKVLFDDEFFIKSLTNTWLLWLWNFIPQLGIAMLLAVWFTNLRLRIKGVGFWRALFYLPNLLMPATIAVLFFNFFSFYGPVNQILVRSGFMPEAFNYFLSEWATRGIVVFIQWWMWFGATIIILMAGMTSISPSLYESALVDGASSAQMFAKITLPLLKPVILYTLVTSLVGGMQMWDIPYMISGGRGAPNGSIMTMNVLMYMKLTSPKGHIGAAAAVGVMVFLVTSVVALSIFYFLRSKDEEPQKAPRGKRAQRGTTK